jgi:hypothetical protein
MKIECLIKRDGPTHVTLAGFDYVFAPDKNGRKVCEVMSTDHQAHFLALKDYRKAEDYEKPEPAAVPKEGDIPNNGDNKEPLHGSEDEPPSDGDEDEGDDDLLGKPDGTPYASAAAAKRGASKHHGLEPDEVNVVEVEGGYALEPKEG